MINMFKNHILDSETKYITIKYHVLRKNVSEKEIRLEYINTK